MRVAEERAAKYAPYPKQYPATVGALTAVGAAVVMSVFMMLSGIESDRLAWQQMVVLMISFGAGYGYIWSQQQKHLKAVVKEYMFLEKANDATRP